MTIHPERPSDLTLRGFLEAVQRTWHVMERDEVRRTRDRCQEYADALKAQPLYLIWATDHDAWWMPKRSGYTNDVAKAGRYEGHEVADILAGDVLREQIVVEEAEASDDKWPANRPVTSHVMQRRAQRERALERSARFVDETGRDDEQDISDES